MGGQWLPIKIRETALPLVVLLLGSGALPGKILLVRIIVNDIIDAYFRSG